MCCPFANSFAGRSVFVTGHTGFKGSWLFLWLERLGARVTGYVLELPTNPSHFAMCHVEKLLERHFVAAIPKCNPSIQATAFRFRSESP